MTPQMSVQQHAVHEQRDGSSTLFGEGDVPRGGWYAVPAHISGPPRGGGGRVRFLEFLCTLIAADLDRSATDFDLDGVRVKLAVTSSASFVNHLFLQYPKSGYPQ